MDRTCSHFHLHGCPPQHLVAGGEMLPLLIAMESGTRGRRSSSSRMLPLRQPPKGAREEDCTITITSSLHHKHTKNMEILSSNWRA
jgi:hypothetical protein